MDITPKQSLEVENGKWKVRYNHPHTSIPMDSAKSTIRGCGSGTIRAKKSGSNGTIVSSIRTVAFEFIVRGGFTGIGSSAICPTSHNCAFTRFRPAGAE